MVRMLEMTNDAQVTEYCLWVAMVLVCCVTDTACGLEGYEAAVPINVLGWRFQIFPNFPKSVYQSVAGKVYQSRNDWRETVSVTYC